MLVKCNVLYCFYYLSKTKTEHNNLDDSIVDYTTLQQRISIFIQSNSWSILHSSHKRVRPFKMLTNERINEHTKQYSFNIKKIIKKFKFNMYPLIILSLSTLVSMTQDPCLLSFSLSFPWLSCQGNLYVASQPLFFTTHKTYTGSKLRLQFCRMLSAGALKFLFLSDQTKKKGGVCQSQSHIC